MNPTLLNPEWSAEVIARQAAATRALLQALAPARSAYSKIIANFLESDSQTEETLRKMLAEVTPEVNDFDLRGESLDAILAESSIEETIRALGKNLRRQRKAKGLTQIQLADHEAVATSQATIARLENGRYRPSDKLLAGIAEALGCSVDDLWADDLWKE